MDNVKCGEVGGRVYGVGGKLFKAVQSFYVVSTVCVQVGNDVSKWFLVIAGLSQICVMSPCCLIYIYIYIYIYISS